MRLRRLFLYIFSTVLLSGCAVFRSSGAPNPKRMPAASEKLGVAGISVGMNYYGNQGTVGKKLIEMSRDELARTGLFTEVKLVEPMELSDADFLVESRVSLTQDGS